ncbi:murein transglycosylase [Azospirillum brasilense]|uniref:peptidoglycan lytic exotransglycosylase n=1 Tax=Azospirillum brasilense TaxID=192 RepID=A0A0P0E902_AZOBR|nr:MULTISPECIES: murein transglycosylase A [Azospirillum]ALJ34009.1 murein transglycosylase [Azospirillum brasilense]MDW7553026.1 murein transglycosylase A [Azospirillum brasilense]MDW7591782.1 murein transglycosylase A [Azospirillum brasilense]MDW7627941.1 murein transglycosylase A [Azospirillum brasilense]MDX5952590.1 murein transglycosylase A [Azospirillum brasilense]
MLSLPVVRLSAAAVLAAAFLIGCERKEEEAKAPPPPPPEKLVLTPVAFAALPGWSADRVAEAVPAFQRSCAKVKALAADRSIGPDGVGGKAADWQAPCAELAKLPPGDDAAARAYFETWFTPYAAANNEERRGLFTGYYEVELKGSRTPDPAFPVPLYKRPADLVMVDLGEFADRWKGERTAGRVTAGRLKPFEDRAAIEAGALSGKGLELVWLQDPIATFFLHIQGSGRVSFPDGTETRVGYAAQNGHKYVAIGRELIDRGALKREEVSLQTIRAWLQANPGEAAALMNKNPSYVFFQELKGEGPNGAQNVALTPGRSLAIDSKFLPYGVPVWLDAEDPLDAQTRLRRLLIAQDTGGAIRGPVRGDVFWGHGPEAEEKAGVMKSAGEYYVLLPKTVAPAS